MNDFVVNGFERHVGSHDAGNVVLQRGAKDAAEYRDDEQPHQDARERAAEMKSAVKQNHGQREKTQPEMAAHPGLRPADTPGGHALSRAEKRSKKHEGKTDAAEKQANRAAAARSLRRIERIKHIDHCGRCQNGQRGNGPVALGSVQSHFRWPWPSMSEKNVRGSTRCAASCGHAYTQLGSFKCVHKSHEVAFCLIVAFLRPVRSGSSIITSNGCKLMLP